MKKKTILLFLMLIMLMSCFNDLNDLIYEFSEFKEPICVKIGVPVNGNGRGWANARNSLQTAIGDASPGDEIWVAGDMTVSSAIDISEAVSIYGGFKGNESKREEAKGRSNVINTGSLNYLFTITAAGSAICGFSFTNSTGCAVQLNADLSADISNCEFKNNYAGLSGGGGVSCSVNNFLNVNNCVFTGNVLSGGGLRGGAICFISGVLNISNSIFNENLSSSYGGAIYCDDGSSLTVKNSYFFKNHSSSIGGAIYSNGSNVINISDNCIFDGNYAYSGGAILITGNSTVQIDNNCFFHNNYVTSGSGGAILLTNFIDAAFVDIHFKNNYTISAVTMGGGAIAATNSVYGNLIIKQCIFESNYTLTSVMGGGAILLENNINSQICDSAFLYNSVETGNGGAIYKTTSVMLIMENNYFQGNTPDDVY
ncbi:MAG: hypothetical protein JW982_07350 [Spirochaetes bacterium]|nr:hypothetical protein [Spirochaetota bacterium]